MTYAAQVRNVSKSVSHQVEEDFYDINSLRIICKYFVGSIVTVKTADEIIEGVLHTISHNKICLTLVTCAKGTEPEKITETASSKLINLSDVLFISTNNSTAQEVTVKGKYIKINNEINGKDKRNNNYNVKLSNNNNNLKVLTKVELEPSDNNIKNEDQYNNKLIELDSKHIENSVSEINRKNEEPKKTFSFNPNAPEFKPRINTVNSENINSHLIFSPHPQPYPTVFTPNSAPAIFVPNIFFYAPNQSMNNIESRSFDSNIANSNSPAENNMDILSDKNLPDEQFSRKQIPEMHIAASPGMPIPHMLPIFPPSLPIFVPNHSFKFNTLPTFSSNADDTEESDDVSENNELSNPSNWPPLPLPVKQVSNININHPNTNSENQKFA